MRERDRHTLPPMRLRNIFSVSAHIFGRRLLPMNFGYNYVNFNILIIVKIQFGNENNCLYIVFHGMYAIVFVIKNITK